MRARGYCYTLNNYTLEEVKELKALDVTYHILGYETGENGTPHIQGYLYFKNKKSFKQLKKLIPRAHVEQQNGSIQQAADYCRKDNNFEEVGVLPVKGNMSAKERTKRLREVPLSELVDSGELSMYSVASVKKARVILAQENSAYTHNDTRGIWYYGEPGTGKSRKAREENPDAFIKSQNKWFCGYAGEKTIILDDLDTNVLGHYLKIWTDRYSCSGEVKGGTVNLQHELFIVTSNYHPDSLWSEDPILCEAIKRRFKITRFNKPL